MAFALLLQLALLGDGPQTYWVYDTKGRALAPESVIDSPSGIRTLAHESGLTRAVIEEGERFARFTQQRSWTAVANSRYRPIVVARGTASELAVFGRLEPTLVAGTYRIYLGPGIVDPQAAAALIRTHAAWALPDEWIRLEKRTFNDPMYGELWHLHPVTTPGIAADANIHADEAWLTTTGNATPIAILDDGFLLTHEDLAPNLLRDASNNPIAYDFVDHDSDPSPHTGDDHGTHVMGVALAKGNNGLGVSGVCPDCRAIAERVFAESNFNNDVLLGSSSDAADAFHFAAANGARVINNSWGPLIDANNPQYAPLPALVDQAISDVVRAAPAGHSDQPGGAGVLIAWAGGNNSAGASLSLITFDGWASDPRVISVGASNGAATRADYSDVGPPVDLLGPSSDASRGLPRLPTTDYASNASYGTLGGTSGAAPVVAGVAALVLSVYPELTLAQLFEVLLDSADHIDSIAAHYSAEGASCTHGHGRVNAAAALALAAARQADYAGGRTLHFELCGDGIDNDGNSATPDDSGACARCIPTRKDDPVDGVDNNCDGFIDNPTVCVDPRGARCVSCAIDTECQDDLRCLAQGSAQYCIRPCSPTAACASDEECISGECEPVTGGIARSCSDFSSCGSAGTSTPEVCDGRDNDCNGTADDFTSSNADFQHQTALCRLNKVGVCSTAMAVCTGAAWSCVFPATYELNETTCDNLDNDCDGVVDEGCPTATPPTPVTTAAKKKNGCHAQGDPVWLVIAAFMGSWRYRARRRLAQKP